MPLGEFISNRCQNGGTCTNNINWQTYSCSCEYGFSGKDCEISNKNNILNRKKEKSWI